MTPTKSDILAACREHLSEKIDLVQSEIKAAQDAANQETKSSMGDKYETGRAMSQNARNLLQSQLQELNRVLKAIQQVDPHLICKKVEFGALVNITLGWFFIGASLGEVSVKGEKVMVISASSPLAQAMNGLKTGVTFDWRGKPIEVIQID